MRHPTRTVLVLALAACGAGGVTGCRCAVQGIFFLSADRRGDGERRSKKDFFWVCYRTGTSYFGIFKPPYISKGERHTLACGTRRARCFVALAVWGAAPGVTGSAGSGRVERNWAGNVEYNGARAHFPSDVEALVDAVRGGGATEPLHAVGSRHSFSAVADTVPGGRLVSTMGMRRVLDVDAERGRVAVEPGITFQSWVPPLLLKSRSSITLAFRYFFASREPWRHPHRSAREMAFWHRWS